MPPKAISLDHVELDFSAVTRPGGDAKGDGGKSVIDRLAQGGRGGAVGPAVQEKAFDPFLSGGARHNRKRALFGGQTSFSSEKETNHAAREITIRVDKEKTEEELDKLVGSTSPNDDSEVQQRLEQYKTDLRDYSRNGNRFSLISQLFDDGVPDIAPWDRWMFDVLRYDEKHSLYHGGEVLPSAKTPSGKVGVHKVADPYLNSAALDVVHHPVIGVNHYTKLYLQQQSPVGLDESKYKTKEQLREEKRARLLAKQQRLREEREAAKQRGEDTKSHTRLHSKSLTSSLFIASNPIAADTAVLDQYEQRFRDHQLQNHQRHMEALPHQIMKRRRDRLRHASETPSLRAYRVFPIPNPLLLAKLRTFANDNLLRGFVLYVGRSDALIVLSGGSTAMRHMERWILEKMHWERKDTTATRVCHIPLPDAQCISFHLPSHRVRKEEQPEGELHTKKPKTTLDHEEEEFQETVFMKYVDTVAEGETFLQYLPCGEERIMHNLTSVWRSAFLVGV